MLRLALGFVVIALISALFGFGGVANLSFEAARILFFVFLVLVWDHNGNFATFCFDLFFGLPPAL